MSQTQRRNQIVLFRLTEQEHQELAQLCAARGGRSISEFVRLEVLSPTRCQDIEPLRELIGSMERRLENLEGIHEALLQRIHSLSGTVSNGSRGRAVAQP